MDKLKNSLTHALALFQAANEHMKVARQFTDNHDLKMAIDQNMQNFDRIDDVLKQVETGDIK